MENITQGHWVFAGIFAIVFIVAMAIAYRKDKKTHDVHYKGSSIFIGIVILIAFLLFVFKDFLK